MSEIVELKAKTEKLEKKQLENDRLRELDAQEKKKSQTPARSSARVKAAAEKKDVNEEEVFLDYEACKALADDLGFRDKNKNRCSSRLTAKSSTAARSVTAAKSSAAAKATKTPLSSLKNNRVEEKERNFFLNYEKIKSEAKLLGYRDKNSSITPCLTSKFFYCTLKMKDATCFFKFK
jgi:hypothetical protein